MLGFELVWCSNLAEVEVVVVGGGIVGVTAALALAERGVDVRVAERAAIAGAASGRNAGLVAGGGWGRAPDLDATLTMGSRDRFVELVDERGRDIGLDRTGTLTLVRTEAEWAHATTLVEASAQAGRALQLLPSHELLSLEPAVDPNLLGAVLDPFGVRAEPVAATAAFAAEAEAAGATVTTGVSVRSLRALAGGGWEVVLDGGGVASEVVGADAVVIAAGPWCGEVGALVGVDIPIVAVRGQMWSSAPQPQLLRHGIAAAESSLAWASDPGGDADSPPNLTHRHGERITRHLYGRQRPDGSVVFGGDRVLDRDLPAATTPTGATLADTPVGPADDDPGVVDRAGIGVNHRHVTELIPAVGSLPPVRTWSGAMPFSLDGRPLIGPIPDRRGLFLAGGLASSGFGRGPMTGELIASIVVGESPAVDLTAASPAGRVRTS